MHSAVANAPDWNTQRVVFSSALPACSGSARTNKHSDSHGVSPPCDAILQSFICMTKTIMKFLYIIKWNTKY